MWQRPNSDGKTLTTSELLYKAESYCSKAEHCEQELRDKLYAWGADKQQTDEIIDDLIDNGFLSAERYCHAFVHDKILFQGWGREKVRAALAAKRLPSSLVKETLDNFPEDDYMSVLRRVEEQKNKTMREGDDELRREKMLRYLLSRGFTYGDIAKI